MEQRLIDAYALKEAFTKARWAHGMPVFDKDMLGYIKQVIANAPTIDTGDAKYLEERDADAFESGYIQGLSERAVGKWIFDGFCFSTTKFKCSICHLPELEKTNFCPNCGARMEDRR